MNTIAPCFFHSARKTKELIPWLSLVLAVVALPARAEDQSKSAARTSFYVGVAATNVSIGGDFDGNNLYTGGSVEVLPAIDKGSGKTLMLGAQSVTDGGMYVALEINQTNTSAKSVWAGMPFDVEYSSLNLDLLVGGGIKKFHPYLLLGWSPDSTVVVKRGSTNGRVVQDAKFTADGFRIGAGLFFYAHRNLGIHMQYVYRVLDEGTEIGGVVSGDAGDPFSTAGTTLTAGLRFNFDFAKAK